MQRDIHSSKIQERRKKRLFIPTLYFIMEMLFIWLVLSLIQLKFDLRDWEIWSMGVFVLFGIYSFSKTVHVYKRQKNYKE